MSLVAGLADLDFYTLTPPATGTPRPSTSSQSAPGDTGSAREPVPDSVAAKEAAKVLLKDAKANDARRGGVWMLRQYCNNNDKVVYSMAMAHLLP